MSALQDRILLVEKDPEIYDLINHQVLQPQGYRVKVVHSSPQAIQEVSRFSPDLVIANLNLPGLSGKDLLAAFSSLGRNIPIIIIVEKGVDSEIVQAFRLGAFDFIALPLREAEVVATVERALRQVRAQRERDQLAAQFNQTNLELQRRIRELTTIITVGKAVTSITDQSQLFEKIVEGAIFVSEAECGWLLTRIDPNRSFKLSAFKNLPQSLEAKLNLSWDDGVSSEAAHSGKPLSLYGEQLKNLKILRTIRALMVMPVKVMDQVLGLLVVTRPDATPFTTNQQLLLGTISDYTSMLLLNMSLFQVLDEKTQSLHQLAEKKHTEPPINQEAQNHFKKELRVPLMTALGYLGMLVDGQMGALSSEQNDALRVSKDKLQQVLNMINSGITVEADNSSLVTK